MKSRRDFFTGLLSREEKKPEEQKEVKIPLNRLNELPGFIIEQIEPVFFPESRWSLKKNILHIEGNNFLTDTDLVLNDIELKAFSLFRQNKPLQQTALNISNESDSDYLSIYKTVTSLFYKLASFRVCHPKQILNIDEILSSGFNSKA
jgi:hypothetical protein